MMDDSIEYAIMFCSLNIFCSIFSALGSGGNNHAVEYYKETGYPLCVKLGTITQSEAGTT